MDGIQRRSGRRVDMGTWLWTGGGIGEWFNPMDKWRLHFLSEGQGEVQSGDADGQCRFVQVVF